MAKKCVKVAASKRAKAHVRCFEGAEKAGAKSDDKKVGASGGGGFGEPSQSFTDSYNDAVKKGHIPKDMDYKEVLEMSGMHSDFGSIKSSKFEITKNGFEVEIDADQVFIRTFHTKGEIYIDRVVSKGGSDGKGRKLMDNIIKRGQQQDISNVSLFAASQLNGAPANGFYTWPRLGFETKNKKSLMQYNDFPGSKFKGIDSLNKLMMSKEGRDYWKSDGKYHPDNSVYEMTFSLKEGSNNIKIFKGG